MSVLIVNFNSTDLLRRSLAALNRSSISDQLEVVVVDNASADFNLAAMLEQFPEIRFRQQQRNATWTGGNNIAFEDTSGELLLLLNPDTAVEPLAIERAVRHLESRSKLRALGAYLIGQDGELQRYYRRLPDVGDLPVIFFERLFRDTRRGRRYLMADEPFDVPTRVPQPPGAFLLVRRSAIGNRLLDPRYFNFVSDVDLCRRLDGAVAVFPDVRCHHVRAGAGVGTRDASQRLRLYHDFAWGFLIYFDTEPLLRRVYVWGWTTAYLVSRLSRVAVLNPRVAGEAVRTLWRWLRKRPPIY